VPVYGGAPGRSRRAAVRLGYPAYASGVALLLLVQLALMGRLLQQPRERAPWYNATGTTLYVAGMLVSAFALRPALLQLQP
jgi:chlorophyll/bacteriochlorophyll a synthase